MTRFCRRGASIERASSSLEKVRPKLDRDQKRIETSDEGFRIARGRSSQQALNSKGEEKLAWLEVSSAYLTFSHLGLTSAISFADGKNGMGVRPTYLLPFPDTKCGRWVECVGTPNDERSFQFVIGRLWKSSLGSRTHLTAHHTVLLYM